MFAQRERSGRVSVMGIFLFFVVLLAGMAMGVVLCVIFPDVCNMSLFPDDTAYALIRVAMNPESIVYEKGPTDIRDYEVFKNTQLGLIKSPLVLTSALRKKHVADLSIVRRQDDPLDWLEKKLQATYIDDSEIIRVSLPCGKPNEAAELVNAVVDAYIDKVVNQEEQKRRETLAELTKVYNEKEDEVRRKRSHFIELADQLNASQSEAVKVQAEVNIRELFDLRGALIRMNMNLGKEEAALKAKQAMLERLDKAPVSEIELGKLVEADPVCKILLERIVEFRSTAAQHKPVNPSDEKKVAVDPLVRQLKSLENEYEIRKNDLRDLLKNAKRTEIEEEIAAEEVQVELLNQHEKDLAAKVEAQKEKVSEIGKSSIEIDMMAAELEILQKSLAEIAAMREKLLIESRARPRITLVSAAQLENK